MLVSWSDILDGAIANAAWGIASMAIKPRMGRRVAAALDTAAWADTKQLIRETLAGMAADQEIPDLPPEEITDLMSSVARHEVQGALQALLATRLTDAPEIDAARARQAVRLALAGPSRLQNLAKEQAALQIEEYEGEAADPGEVARYTGEQLVRFYDSLAQYADDRISALAAMLEGRIGFAGLAQVRAEAYSSRIVALLGAIERQVAALADPEHEGRDEAAFVERYRRQAHQRHGFLIPPDFDRRRRVAVADIYVPTRIKDEDSPERAQPSPAAESGSLNVWDLAGRLDRTVLLGDPGGGKTTAANVLTDYFADNTARRIPFLVTLREYAAKAPIQWSVAECIEQNLRTLYQSPSPDGLVERLLVTGRAAVIFDGLDELLDTSRRRDVSDRVEQFCSAYPLTPVLVTSRVVGYDQARLDDTQFTCYQLGGFGDNQVVEYARRWFATQEDISGTEAAAKAEAFLAESANAADLRANPLLLSLMCILYRGKGSLPGDRTGIYARCAELLLRKWDEQRDLYKKLASDHLIEPTLRYLAWWLFTRDDNQASATELELVAKTTEFLHGREYETTDEAWLAARGFVEFCRGRTWVFSDVGTTADGEKLYAFTHRTFMEYFAAWNLATTSDTPEDLARELVPLVALDSWHLVGELAVKLKSDMSARGGDRIYASLLDPAVADSLVLPESPVRPPRGNHLLFLIRCLDSVKPSPGTIRSLSNAAFEYTFSEKRDDRAPLAALIGKSHRHRDIAVTEIWARLARLTTAGNGAGCGKAAMFLITFGSLYEVPWPDETRKAASSVLADVGRWLDANPAKLRIWHTFNEYWSSQDRRPIERLLLFYPASSADELTALAVAALVCWIAEVNKFNPEGWPDPQSDQPVTPYHYVTQRLREQAGKLPALAVPEHFQETFRSWAAGKDSFIIYLGPEYLE